MLTVPSLRIQGTTSMRCQPALVKGSWKAVASASSRVLGSNDDHTDAMALRPSIAVAEGARAEQDATAFQIKEIVVMIDAKLVGCFRLLGRLFVFSHDAEITLLPRQRVLDLGTLLLGAGFVFGHGQSSAFLSFVLLLAASPSPNLRRLRL